MFSSSLSFTSLGHRYRHHTLAGDLGAIGDRGQSIVVG
jgi:hypothetical protein